ncbi:MAG: hypothetical protein WC637_21925 [Victivallales bacterium]|jgi:hypothetical protein
MDFTFKIKSVKSGWMEIEAVCQGQSFLMNVCGKSDPLDELLDLLIKLNDLCSSGNDFSDSPGDGIYLFWEGDNSQYTLKFTPMKNRMVKIEISYCENTNAGIHIRDFTKISGEASLDMLVKTVYHEIFSMLKNTGFAGYRAEWRKSCFPVCCFLRLRRIAKGSEAKGSVFLDELSSLREISASLE